MKIIFIKIQNIKTRYKLPKTNAKVKVREASKKIPKWRSNSEVD
jgi:hypothetical protein